MKKLIIGAVIGAGIGYLLRKVEEEGYYDELNDDLNKFASKTKKKLKDIVDVGKNEAEYIKDRISDSSKKVQDLLKDDFK